MLRTSVPPPPIENVTLPSGLEVLIRPIESGDEPRLRDGLEKLSPKSKYQRFLRPDFHPSDADFWYLAHPDVPYHLCLVMGVPATETEPEKGIAVARSIRIPDLGDDVAEFAIVVVDDYQGQGVGRTLLRSLSRWAYETGVRRWYSIMVANNEAVVKAAQAIADLEERKIIDPGVMECTFRLRPPGEEDAPAA